MGSGLQCTLSGNHQDRGKLSRTWFGFLLEARYRSHEDHSLLRGQSRDVEAPTLENNPHRLLSSELQLVTRRYALVTVLKALGSNPGRVP